MSKLHTKQTTRTFYRLLAIKYDASRILRLIVSFDKEIYCTCNLMKDSVSFRTPRTRACKFQEPGRLGDYCVLWALIMVLGLCYAFASVPLKCLDILKVCAPLPQSAVSMGTYKLFCCCL